MVTRWFKDQQPSVDDVYFINEHIHIHVLYVKPCRINNRGLKNEKVRS
jgi:hypothetical protein